MDPGLVSVLDKEDTRPKTSADEELHRTGSDSESLEAVRRAQAEKLQEWRADDPAWAEDDAGCPPNKKYVNNLKALLMEEKTEEEMDQAIEELFEPDDADFEAALQELLEEEEREEAAIKALFEHDDPSEALSTVVRVLPEDDVPEYEDDDDIWKSYKNEKGEWVDGPSDLTLARRKISGGLSEEKKREQMEKRKKTRALALASTEDKELFAKFSTQEARIQSRIHIEEEKLRPRIGDDVGTGAPSPYAFVEIRPRWDGALEEAVNSVVARELGIDLEKASKLVELGSVWYYDEWVEKDWVRFTEASKCSNDQILRIFPNPERHKTCYVEDWQDRIKKIDMDYVFIDKPPLLPCFGTVNNGKETLSNCVKEALRVKKWGGDFNEIQDELEPVNTIDEEVSGLVVLTRHGQGKEYFDAQLKERKVVFEFVALTTAMVEKGIYRHFYHKDTKKPGLPKPALYKEIPPEQINKRQDYDNWEVVEMEVLATAELPGGCAAVRIRTYGVGWKERIRTQLAMLGAPVLNDKAATTVTPLAKEAAQAGGLIPIGSSFRTRDKRSPLRGMVVPGQKGSRDVLTAGTSLPPLGGAVDDETLRGPYGRKLQLLPLNKEAADRGIPQTPQPKVPVALHLARIEFGGRVVTCAPPAYWPEGAAAAVAVKLTESDVKTNITAFLIANGGRCRFGKVGGTFQVKVDWLAQHFPVDRAVGIVFASEGAKGEWEAERRVEQGKKAWGLGVHISRKTYKDKMMRLKEKYIEPWDMGSRRVPTYKDIKRGRVKPASGFQEKWKLP